MPNRWIPLLFPFAQPSPPKPEARKKPAPPGPAPAGFTVEVGGRPVDVALRRNARARRYTLRVHPRGESAVVTLPKRGTVAEAKAFVGRHLDWLEDKLAPAPTVPGQPLEIVHLRGVAHRVRLTGVGRGLVRQARDDSGPVLLVPGAAEHANRRITDFLKRQARADYAEAVARHAAALGVKPVAIRLKDTTSRWGSATSAGTLSFSWRLIMAPPVVLDYLAAHEVAHLKEMNHSDRFWAICYRLAPRTDDAKAWLKAHGRDLHKVG